MALTLLVAVNPDSPAVKRQVDAVQNIYATLKADAQANGACQVPLPSEVEVDFDAPSVNALAEFDAFDQPHLYVNWGLIEFYGAIARYRVSRGLEPRYLSVILYKGENPSQFLPAEEQDWMDAEWGLGDEFRARIGIVLAHELGHFCKEHIMTSARATQLGRPVSRSLRFATQGPDPDQLKAAKDKTEREADLTACTLMMKVFTEWRLTDADMAIAGIVELSLLDGAHGRSSLNPPDAKVVHEVSMERFDTVRNAVNARSEYVGNVEHALLCLDRNDMSPIARLRAMVDQDRIFCVMPNGIRVAIDLKSTLPSSLAWSDFASELKVELSGGGAVAVGVAAEPAGKWVGAAAFAKSAKSTTYKARLEPTRDYALDLAKTKPNSTFDVYVGEELKAKGIVDAQGNVVLKEASADVALEKNVLSFGVAETGIQ